MIILFSGENLFAKTDLSDETVGILLLVISLSLIVVSLILMVKVLNSLMNGSVAKLVKKFINADFPGKLSFLTGYVAILIGTGLLNLEHIVTVVCCFNGATIGAGISHPSGAPEFIPGF